MNDFETVRESIYGPGANRGLAAHDRIEAEVERLRAENKWAHGEVNRLDGEVERLRNRVHVLQGQLDDLAARAALAKEEA